MMKMVHSNESKVYNFKSVITVFLIISCFLLYFLLSYRNDGLMLREKNNFYEMKIRKLRNSNEKYKLSLNMCNSEKQESERGITEIQSSLRSKESECKVVSDDLNNCEVNGDKFFKSIQDAVERTEKIDKNSEQATADLVAELKQLKSDQNNFATLKEDAVKLQSKLDEQTESLKKQINTLNEKSTEEKEQSTKVQEEYDNLTEKLKQYKEQNEELQTKYDNLKDASNKRGFLTKEESKLPTNVKMVVENSFHKTDETTSKIDEKPSVTPENKEESKVADTEKQKHDSDEVEKQEKTEEKEKIEEKTEEKENIEEKTEDKVKTEDKEKTTEDKEKTEEKRETEEEEEEEDQNPEVKD